PRYWERLAPAPTSSSSLSEYVGMELAAYRRELVARDPRRAFQFFALTFAARELVPLTAMRDAGADVVAASVEAILTLDDHFALDGTLAVCADWVARDKRFGELGSQLLERLFSDMERLKTACGMFASAFVIATAYLAEHEVLRQRPVFWRRLAAAAHASL